MPLPPATDDLALLRRFQREREETAFAELLRRHWPMVFGVSQRVLGDAARANEAAQEVFTRLARKAVWFSPGVVLAGWLHRTALHVALTMKRSALRQQQREDESARRLALDATPEDGEAWALVQPHLDEALDGLPRKLRDAVALCYLEGKSRREAGELLGCGENAVSQRLGRALEKLRVTLTKRGVILSGPRLALALGGAAAEAAAVTVPAGLAAFFASAGTLATSGAAATVLTLMAKKSTILTAAVLAIGTGAYFAYRETRKPSEPVILGTGLASGAAHDPKPTAAPDRADTITETAPAPATAPTAPKEASVSRAGAGKLTGGQVDGGARRILLSQDPEEQFRLLHEMGIMLSREGLERALKLLATRMRRTSPQEIDNNAFGIFFGAFVNQWLAEAPTAAARWVMNEQPHHFPWVLQEVAEAFGRDPAAFAEFVQEQRGKAAHGSLRTLLLAQTNPQAFLAAYAAGGVDMSQLEPRMAFDFAVRRLQPTQDGRATPQQVRSVLDHLLHIAAGATDSRARHQILQFVAQGACAAEPPLTMAQLEPSLQALAPAAKERIWAAYAEAIGHAQPAEALDLLRTKVGDSSRLRTNQARLLALWARRDPDAAVSFYNANQLQLGFHEAVAAIASGMAAKDRPAAISWADALPDPAMRSAAIGALALNPNDYAGGLQVLLERPDLAGADQHIATIVKQWAEESPEAAGQWLARIEPGAARVQLAQSIAQQWAFRDPDAAWTFAQREGAPLTTDMAYWLAKSYASQSRQNDGFWRAADSAKPGVQLSAKSGMLTEMYRRNPASADAWLQRQEARGDVQTALAVALTVFQRDSNMVLDQPAAMARTLSRYDAAGVLAGHGNTAVWRLPNYWVETEPNAAVQWSLSLRDETLRNQALKGIYDRTGGKPPAGYPHLFQGRNFAGKAAGPLQ